MDCIKHADIITTFDIRREAFLDKKILSALLKANNMDTHTQLYLAMIWDRVDLAEEKILKGESLVGISAMDSIMMDALDFERTKFIELLVMNGFVMRSFLTVERLRELYNRAVSYPLKMIAFKWRFHCLCLQTKNWKELHVQLKRLVNFHGTEIYLRLIHMLLVAMIKDHGHKFYIFDAPLKQNNQKHQVIDVSQKTFEEPYTEVYR